MAAEGWEEIAAAIETWLKGVVETPEPASQQSSA
jgi:hypothetical protein